MEYKIDTKTNNQKNNRNQSPKRFQISNSWTQFTLTPSVKVKKLTNFPSILVLILHTLTDKTPNIDWRRRLVCMTRCSGVQYPVTYI